MDQRVQSMMVMMLMIKMHIAIRGCVGACFVKYSTTPLIRTLVIRISNYPDRLGSTGKYVQNSTKLTFLEFTGYRIKYSTVLWLIELQIRRGRKV